MVPGAAYSVSDFDSVSLTGGGLHLSIPLVSLPPIAGGKLSATITASYNSKLWDVAREERRPLGTDEPRNYVVDEPQLNDGGGWRIGGPGYAIVWRDGHYAFNYVQPEQRSETDDNDWRWIQFQWWRAYIVTPDGAEHELTPADPAQGYGGGLTRPYLVGSYSDKPEITQISMRYYTTDGTYLTALVHPNGTWVITSLDGTQAERYADGIQRIRDTNGNSIKIFEDENGKHYADELTGREIRVTGDMSSGFQVWYQVTGGSWQHIDVNTGMTHVQGKRYRVNDWNSAAQTEIGQEGDVCVKDAVLDAELPVVREIVFPSTKPGETGRSFSFAYNSDTTESFTANYREFCGATPVSYTTTTSLGLGELSRVTTPSGAVVEYAYSLTATHSFTINVDEITRDLITEKKVTQDGLTFDTWTYNLSWNDGGGSVTNPDGTSYTESAYVSDPGYSFQSGTVNGMGGRVLRSLSGNVMVERRWRPNPAGVLLAAPSGLVAINPVIEAEFTSLMEGGVAVRMSAKTFQYDLNGNVLQTKEYDWFDPTLVTRDASGIPEAVPTGAVLLRQADTSYYNTAADASSPNLYSRRATSGSTLVLNAPQQTSVGNSVTQYSYDGQAYGLAPTAGNVTQASSFDNQGDANPSNDRWGTTSNTYGAYGNLTATTDANGNVTHYFYEDATHALPTKMEVDPLNETGVQTTLTAYDYSTGLVVSTTDPNGQLTTVDYTNHLLGATDPFGRPGTVTGPTVTVGGVSQRRKVFTTYEDSLRRITVESDLRAEGDRLLKTRTTSDKLGRTVLTEQSEDGSGYTVWTRSAYEQGGRVTYASNPMRAGAAATDGWVRTTRDTMGRIVEVATFAGATQPAAGVQCTAAEGCTGKMSTTYYAEFVTVTDQSGKVRRNRTDALGRLVRLDEPSDSNNTLGEYETPTQPTVYSYDVLNNLTSVRQGGQLQGQQYVGGQMRTFAYSTLSRLASATNPESGTVSYAYDLMGNVTKRTDARGVETTCTYDGLNRLTDRSYTNVQLPQGGTVSTPPVKYYYDTQALPSGAPAFARGKSVGRLVAVTYGGAASTTGNYSGGYDELGRPHYSSQVTIVTDGAGQPFAQTYAFGYEYNLDGTVSSETYPSGRVVVSEYDGAGRLAGVRRQGGGYYAGGDPAVANNPNVIAYAAHGAVGALRFGNGLWEHTNYNSKFQAEEIGLGTSRTDSSKLKLEYGYVPTVNGALDPTKNNGNMLSQRISVPAAGGSPAQTFTQSYAYDTLNRLQAAEETVGVGTAWRQVYTYDRYGNRRLDAAQTTWPKLTQPGQTAPPEVANPDINPLTNRIVEDQNGDGNKEYSYDPAGNLTCDAQHCTPAPTPSAYYSYDGENRMVSAGGGYVAGGTSYLYDGDGRRVSKSTHNGESTVFVYDAAGNVVAEYSNEVEYNGTTYLTADTLGSTRVVTNQDGEVESRHDYVPFGEELPVGTGERTAARGYTGESVRKMFTGYQRDEESGLDYAENRYYSPVIGRYTSTDPMAIQQRHLPDPQNLNRYAYVNNNPLKYIDPNALEKIIIIVRTWIPNETVEFMGYVFNGNDDANGNRKPGREGYKTEQWVEYDTDDQKTFLLHGFTGLTHRYNLERNRVVENGEADGKSLEEGLIDNGPGDATATFKGNEANPLAPWYAIGSNITLDLQVNVHSDGVYGDVRVNVSGSHDGYPAYEIIVIRPDSGNASATVYTYDPRTTGETPWALNGGMDKTASGTKIISPQATPPPPAAAPAPANRQRRPRRQRRGTRPRRNGHD